MKSLATNRHLTSGTSSVPLLVSTHLTPMGLFPVLCQHISKGTTSQIPLVIIYPTSSFRALLRSSIWSLPPLTSSHASSSMISSCFSLASQVTLTSRIQTSILLIASSTFTSLQRPISAPANLNLSAFTSSIAILSSSPSSSSFTTVSSASSSVFVSSSSSSSLGASTFDLFFDSNLLLNSLCFSSAMATFASPFMAASNLSLHAWV